MCRLRSNDIFLNYMKSDQEKKSVDKSGEWRFLPLNFKIANILCRLILFCLKEYQNALMYQSIPKPPMPSPPPGQSWGFDSVQWGI